MQFVDVPFSRARRRIVQAGLVGALGVRIPFVLASPVAVPGLHVFDAPSAQTLLQAMRSLFPHAALGDTPYVDCVRAIDARAQQDAAYHELIAAGLARLPADFAGLDSAGATAALAQHGGTPFFNALRSAAGAIYRNPAVWPHFGYPGPSLGFGGYVDRPMLDLAWLEAATR